MSCFFIPKSPCQDIVKMMNKYWWSSNASNSKGIHWLSWDNMSMVKNKCDMGFQNLHDFNLALLGKYSQNFVNNPNFLIARVFKTRYYPDCHMQQAGRGGGWSYIWSGICIAKEATKKGYKWVWVMEKL